MQVASVDPILIMASSDCDSVISLLEDRDPASEDVHGGALQEFGERASFMSISRCSSTSSQSTLSVDATSEQQEETRHSRMEEREHSSSYNDERLYSARHCPRNLLKISKRITGRANRTLYERPLLASNTRVMFPAPSADEINQFLVDLEDKVDKEKHKSFVDRYNFDVVKEIPLPGRFEWVKIQGQDQAA